jgi:hypothetical protein
VTYIIKRLKWSSPILRSGVSVLLLFFSWSCEFKKPIAPVWDQQINVPLANHIYTIDSLLKKDTSIIRVNPSNGYITYAYSQLAGSERIGDKIRMRPVKPAPLSIKIGSLPISVENRTAEIANPGIPSGVIPSGALPSIALILPTFQQIEYVIFDNGMMKVHLTNNLPVSINFINPIILRDNANHTFGPLDITELAAGETKSDSLFLVGRQMSNTLSLDRINITTTGSDGSPVTIPGTIFSITVEFANVEVRSASAKFPPTSILVRDSAMFVVDSSSQPNKVSSATFKQGIVDLKITNNLDVAVQLSLKLFELYDRTTGQQFNEKRTIDRYSSINFSLDFRNYSIVALNPTNPTDKILYSASISQLGSTNDTTIYRKVNSTDSVVVELFPGSATPDTFILQTVTGFLKPTTLKFDSTFNIHMGELPSKFRVDSLRLPEASFKLILKTPNIPIDLTGSKVWFIDLRHEDSVDVDVPSKLLPANSTTPVLLDAEFVPRFTRLISRTHRFPDQVRLHGIADLSKIKSPVSVILGA